MYEKCINCKRLGEDCTPNFYTMPLNDMRIFAKRLMTAKGWKNADLAEESGVKEGTVKNALSQKDRDVYYSTFAPMFCALIGCNGDEETPCPEPVLEESKHLETIARLEKEKEELEERLREEKESSVRKVDFLKDELKKERDISTERKKWRDIFCIIALAALGIIVTALIVDALNSHIGFFWLEDKASYIGDITDNINNVINHIKGGRL